MISERWRRKEIENWINYRRWGFEISEIVLLFVCFAVVVFNWIPLLVR